VIAGLLLGLFLPALSMAHFGALHEALHADAHNANHQCAVQLLEQGNLAAADTIIVVLPITVPIIPTLAVVTAVVPPAAAELPPGRAPPTFFI
jgi:hypothetical protein